MNLITLSGWANFQKMLGEYDITETFWNTSRVKTIEMLEPTVRTNRYNTFSGELAYQKTFREDGGILPSTIPSTEIQTARKTTSSQSRS